MESIQQNEAENLYGFPKLLESYDRKVLNVILEWLGIRRQSEAYELNDIGNGRRFVDKFKEDARYCPEEKSWYVFDGKRWLLDRNNKVQELSKTLAEDIKREATGMKVTENATREEQEAFDKAQKAMHSWASRTAMTDRLSAAAKSASSIPDIITSKDLFDKHENLLNCANGVVDLYSGQLQPHDRKLYLTQLCPIEFELAAKSPEWDNVLATITRKHEDLPAFLQTFCGYVAQGNKSEELLVLCHGDGGTGKGTFWSLVAKALGTDYVRTISSNSLLQQNRSGGAASGDIARLEGCRLALTSEFDRNSKVQENFLKLVSGNDTITARKLYSEEREFEATFQIVFQTNHRPQFDSCDTGNKRRYVEIPFDNVIAEDPLTRVDVGLKKRLLEDQGVLRTVLAWIVAGCGMWRKNGLVLPPCVRDATEQLFRQNDRMADFADDCLLVNREAYVTVFDMRHVYLRWCADNKNFEPLKDREFNDLMRNRGLKYMSKKISGKVPKVWQGVKFTGYALGAIQSDQEIVKTAYTAMQEESRGILTSTF